MSKINMTLKDVFKDLLTLGNTVVFIGFTLWSVFPMYLLGWILAAIARHPLAEEALNQEPVFQMLRSWLGGIAWFPLTLMLVLFLTIFIVISYWLSKYSHPTSARKILGMYLRKFLIPSYLSVSAFASGMASGDSIAGMWPGFFLMVMMTSLAFLSHYVSLSFEKARS